jgi:hypothetical protein
MQIQDKFEDKVLNAALSGTYLETSIDFLDLRFTMRLVYFPYPEDTLDDATWLAWSCRYFTYEDSGVAIPGPRGWPEEFHSLDSSRAPINAIDKLYSISELRTYTNEIRTGLMNALENMTECIPQEHLNILSSVKFGLTGNHAFNPVQHYKYLALSESIEHKRRMMVEDMRKTSSSSSNKDGVNFEDMLRQLNVPITGK